MASQDEIDELQQQINREVAQGYVAVDALKEEGLDEDEIRKLAVAFNPVPVSELPKSCGKAV